MSAPVAARHPDDSAEDRAATIRLPQFEGPLELLLSLVERRQLPITELSLAAVADQYLARVRAARSLDREALSGFLAIATRLVLLKSRALLPRLGQVAEDDREAADDLLSRLETYRAFKLVAQQLASGQAAACQAFPRGLAVTSLPPAEPTALLEPISVERLARLAARERSGGSPAANVEVPRPTRIAVAERLQVLRQRLRGGGWVAWESVGRGTVDEVVATLLAVLELVRRGELRVEQEGLFAPIRLHALDEPPVAGGGPDQYT